MLTLFHHPLCPFSRFARLALAEYGLTVQLIEERAWDRRTEFLTLNPAGTPSRAEWASRFQWAVPSTSQMPFRSGLPSGVRGPV